MKIFIYIYRRTKLWGEKSTRFDQKVNSGFSYHVMEKSKRAFGQPHSNLSIRMTLICDSSPIFTPPVSFSLHILHFRKMWPRGCSFLSSQVSVKGYNISPGGQNKQPSSSPTVPCCRGKILGECYWSSNSEIVYKREWT